MTFGFTEFRVTGEFLLKKVKNDENNFQKKQKKKNYFGDISTIVFVSNRKNRFPFKH